MKNDLYSIDKGKLTLNLHPGQTRAWDSTARVPIVYAGAQSGKTSFGPWWLNREIERCGTGDYIAATATFDLFKLKMLPEIRSVFEGILGGWSYQKSDRVLYNHVSISRRDAPTKASSRIILRSANAPGGLESATGEAAWMDEFGQDGFIIDSWEALNRRVALHQGRILGTTTPYNLGWPKTEIYDRWTAGDPDIEVIQFKSIENPNFSRKEYFRQKRTMPPWKFAMFYDGEFALPAGLIYDAFDTKRHKIAPFEVPAYWPRYGGLDFGEVNTAAICVAENPDNHAYYTIKEYLAGSKTAAEHADELKRWGCRLWVGGSKSEEQWRREFAQAGMPVSEPTISDVEVGIDRVYAAHKSDSLFVFDTLSRYLDEKGRYSRELDKSGQPTEKIKDKNTFHIMDAERYIMGFLRTGNIPLPENQPEQKSKWRETELAAVTADDDDSRWKRY